MYSLIVAASRRRLLVMKVTNNQQGWLLWQTNLSVTNIFHDHYKVNVTKISTKNYSVQTCTAASFVPYNGLYQRQPNTKLLVGNGITSSTNTTRSNPLSCGCRLFSSSEQNTSELDQAKALNQKIIVLGKNGQWKELLNLYAQEGKNFNNVNYATVMVQLRKIPSLDQMDPQFLLFLKDLANKIKQKGLSWFDARQCANIIHAFGKMKLNNNSNVTKVLEWISTPEIAAIFVKNGNPYTISNTAWACAELNHAAPDLFTAIDGRAKWLVENGNSQDVSNATLACAKLNHAAPNLFAAIDSSAKYLVENGKPQEISNTAWACAKLKHASPNLFSAIDGRAKWLVENGNAQNISNIAWACAELNIVTPNIFAVIDGRAKWLVENDVPQGTSNAAWACAKLNIAAPNLFAAIDSRAKLVVENGNAQAMSTTTWAAATLGYKIPMFLDMIHQNLNKLITNSNVQNICNVCYAIAVLGESKKHEASLVAFWNRAIQMFNEGQEFKNEDLLQLFQMILFAKLDGVILPGPPHSLFQKMFQSQILLQNQQTKETIEISKLLHEIGFDHKCEVAPLSIISGGMLAIDLACPKQMIAIEFDGAYHYLKEAGTGKRTTIEKGTTKAKRRFLEQLGWTVINIDYREFNKAIRLSTDKDWLHNRLKAAGASFTRK